MKFLKPILFLSMVAVTSGVVFAEQNTESEDLIKSEVADFSLDIIVSGLQVPWAFTFLPDGYALVGEREMGQISRLNLATGERIIIDGLTDVLRSKKISAGVFDIRLHPDFSKNYTLYIVHAVGVEDANGLAITQAKLIDNQLQESKILFETTPRISGKWHFGGRLVVTDSHLFLSTGDGYNHSALSQELTAHAGKIIRLNLDGSVPKDNPFVNHNEALAEIWSLGVRNPQAMTKHPKTGQVWQIEHGPQGGDEINLAEAGKNYGWPVITYGEEYGGGPIGDGITHFEGMEQPLYYWTPSIAPSGATFYDGTLFPRWNGNLFVGALAGKQLSRLVIENDRVLHEEALLKEKGWRIRFVEQGPKGNLYIGVDAGHIVKISPASLDSNDSNKSER